MTRGERAERIQKILDELYPQPDIPLQHEDPFTLLVAVVLSAQCTDKRVNEITPRLFAEASTPAKLAAMPLARLESIIRPCGLAPAKAKNLKETARRLLEQHGGQVPRDLAALEALPGVGHKTASVVSVQAFGIAALPVDTHIHRLAARWRLSTSRSVVQTERDLKRLFLPETWGKLHLQIIYFGREHCPAARHALSQCPICSWAASKAQQEREAERWRSRAKPRRV
jgi:endonuclease-3